MRLFVRDRNFYKDLVILAIPIMLQNFITFAVSFADNVMVGSLGEYAISGVYVGNQIQMLLQFVVMGIQEGMSILATQYWGRKDAENIKHIVAVAFRICLAVGLFFTLVMVIVPEPILRLFTDDEQVVEEALVYVRILCWSYALFSVSQILISAMRSVEQTKIGFYVSLMSLVVNVTLNYILIFGKLGIEPMGVKGAAIATLVSRLCELLLAAAYVLFADRKLIMRPRDFTRWNRTLAIDLAKYGSPVLMGQIVWAINNLGQSAIIGHFSTEAVAAVSIAGMLNNMLFLIARGLASGLGIITGKTIGAGEYEKMKRYAVTSQVIFLCLGIFLGVMTLLLMNPIISLYNINEATIKVTRQFIIILAVTMVGRCYQGTCLAGLVKAGGDVSFVFKNDTIFVFGVVLPSALVAMHLFNAPAWVIYLCLQSDQILKCFVAFFKINSFNWMKNLTRSEMKQEYC